MFIECFWMALVALVSALSKLAFLVCPGIMLWSEICILSTGRISQKLSLFCAFTSAIPFSKASPPLYKMLSFVLSACEFRESQVFLLVEQAIKSNKNPEMRIYLMVLVFKAKRLML